MKVGSLPLLRVGGFFFFVLSSCQNKKKKPRKSIEKERWGIHALTLKIGKKLGIKDRVQEKGEKIVAKKMVDGRKEQINKSKRETVIGKNFINFEKWRHK